MEVGMSLMSNRILGRIILIAGTMLGAGSAFAQAQATQPGPAGYPESYSGVFYPSAELRALPAARASAVATAAELRRAEDDLARSVDEMRRIGNRSPEFKVAVADERIAWEALKAAREEALRDLKHDETYQAAVDLRDRLTAQIAVAREKPQTTIEQLRAMAEVKLSHARTISAMESAAIGADPRVEAARQRLIDAGATLAELREQLSESILADPNFQAGRKAIANAKVAVQAADAYYLESKIVAQAGLNYAYELLAPRPYIVNQPYGYYGGYGGYTPVGYPIGYPVMGSPGVQH
jgi:hypothetical protein